MLKQSELLENSWEVASVEVAQKTASAFEAQIAVAAHHDTASVLTSIGAREAALVINGKMNKR